MKLKNRFLPFYQAIPKLLLFQVISSTILMIVTWGISSLTNLLLGLSGKAAISSGDFAFLFTRWQGYAMILLVLLMVVCYIAIELNALILFCGKLIDGENPSLWKCIGSGFAALKKYLNYRGLIIILYAAILSPVLGLGFSLSLTKTFYIPNFIMSVIQAKPLFMIGYVILQIVLIIIALLYCFILHGVMLDGKTMKEASVNSRRMVLKNWKKFLLELLIFLLLTTLTVAVLIAVLFLLPLLIIQMIPMSESVYQYCLIFICLFGILLIHLIMSMSVSFLIIKLSTMYRRFQSDGQWSYQKREKKKHPWVIVCAIAAVLFIGLFSLVCTAFFDQIFPTEVKADIVAHRAGGNEAPENTVKGIETAYELNAGGCEIDIQRTLDGYYVVNHDNTFERVAGVDKKPSEMTLEEVKALRVDGEPVATLEEMLEASRDKVMLFVELKGETADQQMADDAVRIIKEMGMEDQAVLISLKYDVLEYIEEKYPEMLTGYLAFVSFGRIEETPFDYLALEEEIATDETIQSIHEKGKKILVWTVNETDDIENFLTSDADGIITDTVKTAKELKEALNERDSYDVIINVFFKFLRDVR